MTGPAIRMEQVSKAFTLHLRGGARLPVVQGVDLAVMPGECVVLGGPSGSGKSSIIKMAFGTYRCDAGRILVRDGDELVDVARAEPRRLLTLRRTSMAYVSQFLRVIPRVSALDLVVEPLLGSGLARADAEEEAALLLHRLSLPERLWALPPATFSGGEQQRVNIARGFAAQRPILLLDEPTASLDAANRAAVIDLIRERTRAGVAILGIFHDGEVRDAVADRIVDVTRFTAPMPQAA